jgi:hypothetical protein
MEIYNTYARNQIAKTERTATENGMGFAKIKKMLCYGPPKLFQTMFCIYNSENYFSYTVIASKSSFIVPIVPRVNFFVVLVDSTLTGVYRFFLGQQPGVDSFFVFAFFCLLHASALCQVCARLSALLALV